MNHKHSTFRDAASLHSIVDERGDVAIAYNGRATRSSAVSGAARLHNSWLQWALGATVAWLFSSLWAQAGLPQPMCIYYGQAVDGYGMPYLTNATVTLMKGTNQIARQVIRGSLSPGVNFALYVHLDSGGGSKPYSPRALSSGDFVSIYVNGSEC